MNALLWHSALGAGGAPALVPLGDISLDAGPAAAFDFAAIDQSYAALLIRGWLRSTRADFSINGVMHINGDLGANYDWLTAHSFVGFVSDSANLGQTYINVGDACADNAPVGDFSPVEILLPGYSSTHINKMVRSFMALQGQYAAAHLGLEWSIAYWNSTAAITEVSLAPAADQWAQYSRLTLYGVV